jgi:hypothetical protein
MINFLNLIYGSVIAVGIGLAMVLSIICLRRVMRNKRKRLALRSSSLWRTAARNINSDSVDSRPLSDLSQSVPSSGLAECDVLSRLNDEAAADRAALQPFVKAGAALRRLPTPLDVLLAWERKITLALFALSVASTPLLVAFVRGTSVQLDGVALSRFTLANADADTSVDLIAGTWFSVSGFAALWLAGALFRHLSTFRRNAPVTARRDRSLFS